MGILVVEGGHPGRGGWVSLSWKVGILVVEDGYPCRGGSPFGRG